MANLYQAPHLALYLLSPPCTPSTNPSPPSTSTAAWHVSRGALAAEGLQPRRYPTSLGIPPLLGAKGATARHSGHLHFEEQLWVGARFCSDSQIVRRQEKRAPNFSYLSLSLSLSLSLTRSLSLYLFLSLPSSSISLFVLPFTCSLSHSLFPFSALTLSVVPYSCFLSLSLSLCLSFPPVTLTLFTVVLWLILVLRVLGFRI